LTTCASDHQTWANEFPAGTTVDGAVTVRRFPTVVNEPARDRTRIFTRILAGERIAIQDQQLWMNDGFRCPELWHHILDHSADYSAIVLAPYMFWTTFACGQIDPQKTILMPCLHDEPTVHLDLFKPLVSGAAGVWFLSRPEAALASRVFHVPSNHEVVGAPVPDPEVWDPDRFVREFGFERPFVFYAGRREPGKGWNELRDAFSFAISQGIELDLVTAGVGDPVLDSSTRGRVHDVGFLSDQQRNDAMAAATAYVQPGRMESFSLSVMEAWLAGTPVIGNGASAVVSHHIEQCDAGVTYRSPLELLECLRFVATQPEAAAKLAAPGRAYVLDNYAPEVVLDRMEASLLSWLPDEGEAA
ncbi:MAG: glycosyltransferase family 4 protein, partial [Acidimicrobiales bacterium]|nr:glycosyltransferase family 4 protein [Acidimicrobiales bacterium]